MQNNTNTTLDTSKNLVVDTSKNLVETPSVQFAVTKQDFLEYTIFQRGFSTIPAWFYTNDTKADEIMTKFNELAKHYK